MKRARQLRVSSGIQALIFGTLLSTAAVASDTTLDVADLDVLKIRFGDLESTIMDSAAHARCMGYFEGAAEGLSSNTFAVIGDRLCVLQGFQPLFPGFQYLTDAIFVLRQGRVQQLRAEFPKEAFEHIVVSMMVQHGRADWAYTDYLELSKGHRWYQWSAQHSAECFVSELRVMSSVNCYIKANTSGRAKVCRGDPTCELGDFLGDNVRLGGNPVLRSIYFR